MHRLFSFSTALSKLTKASMVAIAMIIAIVALPRLSHAEVKTVPHLDLERYWGRWYHIASNPVPAHKDCYCSQQTFSTQQDGSIAVQNSCNRGSANGPFSQVRGLASVEDRDSNAKLVLDFGQSRKMPYWIIGIDSNYQWAIVSDSTGRSLFLLARSPKVSETELNTMIAAASAQVDVSKLQLMPQEGCSYPTN